MRWLTCLFLLLFAGESIASETVAKILVMKSERKLYLVDKDGTNLKEYSIALGFEPVGHKEKQGDGRTPEGVYKITWKNPNSQYYKALRISYPNDKDRAKAKAKGVDPGGDIVIHGLPNGMGYVGKAHLLRDWTWGCIALTNDEIDEVWKLVPTNTPIEIKP